MTTFIHSVIASAIISVALVLIINPADNLEPWYQRLKKFWAFLNYWKQSHVYLSLWIFILSSLIIILYWLMEGILRIL